MEKIKELIRFGLRGDRKIKNELWRVICNDFVIVKNNLDTALDFIAVCVKT